MSTYNPGNVKEQETTQLTLRELDSQGRFAPGNRHRCIEQCEFDERCEPVSQSRRTKAGRESESLGRIGAAIGSLGATLRVSLPNRERGC